MAQLVAHLLCKQGVTGSSPVGSTVFSSSSPVLPRGLRPLARSSLDPRDRLREVRSRGLPGDLADPAGTGGDSEPFSPGRPRARGHRRAWGRRPTRPFRPIGPARLIAGAGGLVGGRSGDSERRPASIFPPPPRGPRHHHTPARTPMRKAQSSLLARCRSSGQALRAVVDRAVRPSVLSLWSAAAGRRSGVSGGRQRLLCHCLCCSAGTAPIGRATPERLLRPFRSTASLRPSLRPFPSYSGG